jgi:glycosyltransferase involved in cell wall biosynthesis
VLNERDDMSIIVNASRIGRVGGLRGFARAVVHCLEGVSGVSTVAPTGIHLTGEIEQQYVPACLASSARISVLRPVLWLAYGAFCFPGSRSNRVLCSTHHVLPFRKHQIVTIHDIRPYYHPDSWVQAVYYRFVLPSALKRCDGILTVSESSRNLLVSVYRIESERVHVVPNVVDCEFLGPAAAEAADASGYLLTVGSSLKHKNVTELLRMHKYWASKYRLKIVASAGQYRKVLLKMVNELAMQDRVEFLPEVSPAELLSLYQHCAALVYPSTMEGFGLPPLEAMACGGPVIVSDIAPFRELYGEVPIYVQLGETESWRAAFAALDGYSGARIRSGVEHARSYSHAQMRIALFRALRTIWGDDCLHEISRV